jgi:tRNA (adenine22-N1)-methyltransferase
MKSRPGTGPKRRLALLAGLVPRGSRVADVGTDHGRLPVLLLRTGRAGHCIATEPSEERLAPLRARLERSPRPRGLEIRVGDGLAPLHRSDRLDVLVLAGMGAPTICRILRQEELRRLGARRVVLQPQTDPAVVRRHLDFLRMTIVSETLLHRSGRFHLVMAAEPGRDDSRYSHPSLSREDLLEAGPCLVRDGGSSVQLYWQQQLRRNERILAAATPGSSKREALRLRDLARRILDSL